MIANNASMGMTASNVIQKLHDLSTIRELLVQENVLLVTRVKKLSNWGKFAGLTFRSV